MTDAFPPGVLMQGHLLKRAQGQSFLTLVKNFEWRFFVLRSDALSYYDADSENPAKFKKSIKVSSFRAVETLEDNTFQRAAMFQIVHEESILYCGAADEDERNQWLRALRKVFANNFHKIPTFHRGAYVKGNWTCCRDKQSTSQGCETTFIYNLPSASAANSRSSGGTKPGSLVGTMRGTIAELRLLQDEEEKPKAPAAAAAVNFSTLAPHEVKVTAKYPYVAVSEGDLSMSTGEVLIVFDKSDPNWWMARNEEGKEGSIPSNFVADYGAIESAIYFHGKMGRDAANEILLREREGSYLVRDSESKPGEYSISLRTAEDVRHYRITNDRSTQLLYVSSKHKFSTIPELVKYHTTNRGGLYARLKHAVPRVNQPAITSLARDKWEIDREELTIGQKLGSGQFGEVYAGLFKKRTKVAVKIMKEGAMSEDAFLEEAQIMKQFNHDYLVKLLAVCSRQRPIYIVTELMDRSLLDHLRIPGQDLSLAVIMYMAIQVCSAMEYLEERNFIHRDLAARNCLVKDPHTVKVSDFGLARHIQDEYSATEGAKFSIKWSALEVILYGRFSTKSDVWSFGVLMWELFSQGKAPYPSMNNQEVMEKISVYGYRLPRPDSCPPRVYDLMSDCWQDTAEKRISFKELMTQLTVYYDTIADDVSEANENE